MTARNIPVALNVREESRHSPKLVLTCGGALLLTMWRAEAQGLSRCEYGSFRSRDIRAKVMGKSGKDEHGGHGYPRSRYCVLSCT